MDNERVITPWRLITSSCIAVVGFQMLLRDCITVNAARTRCSGLKKFVVQVEDKICVIFYVPAAQTVEC